MSVLITDILRCAFANRQDPMILQDRMVDRIVIQVVLFQIQDLGECP
jgi:hypothetical protein